MNRTFTALMHESPLKDNGRIEVIDVLRGFTLLGIAFVHFTEQYYAGMAPRIHENFTNHSIGDQIVSAFVGIFISGKFYMIFSFLFGMSFYIRLSKSENEKTFIPRFTWRLVVLFLIGFIHSLYYRGDILTVYAALGLGLLACYKFPDRLLLILALLLVLDLPAIVSRAADAINSKTNSSIFFNPDQKTLETYYNTVKSGYHYNILKANFYELRGKWDFQVESGRLYITMGLFLLGLYAGRKRIFENIPFFKRLIRYGLWTLLGCIIFSFIFFGGSQMAGIQLSQPVQWLVGGTVYDFFNASLAAIYVGLIVTLFQKDRWRKRLMNFYGAGRMGLTTYLMQTLIGVFIFFSFGLGLLGEIGAAAGLAIGLLAFVVQIIFSNYWLRLFKYGPVEWLWRSLTLLKMQPMRNLAASPEKD